MAATPGSATKLNKLAGIAKLTPVTDEEFGTTLATQVFEKGILLQNTAGQVFVTDGVTALGQLKPLVDKALTGAEKAGLAAAYGTGTYAIAANGVVAHGADGKIDDASLKVVEGGLIVDTYLAKYFENGKIKLDAVPDTIRGHINYVPNYAGLAALTDEQKKGVAFVIDATDDPSGAVKAGAAMYVWEATAGQWIKIAEHESLDINIEALTPNYTNVEAAGAVMYDHTVMLESPTLTQVAALQAAG